MKRILIDILFVISIFTFPWWAVVFGALIALFYFPNYYEIIFLGIITDSLYNAPIARFHYVEFVVTLLCVVLFVCIEVLKRRLRFYGNQ